MEEKLSVLEGLGVLKGLIAGKHWNDLSGTKTQSRENQLKPAFQGKGSKKETKLPKNEGNNSLRNKWNQQSKVEGGGGEEEEEGGKVGKSLKSCDKMETNKSEPEIPEEGEKTFQIDEEHNSRKKTEGCEKTKSKRPELISGEGTTNGLYNGNTATEIPSTVQEWINHLPLKEKSFRERGEGKEENQGTSQVEDNPSIAAKLSREASLQSSSSLDSILDSRRPDPVEIFLNLGFGGVPGVNMENCRIPKRFLVPSKCKGGDWNEFLKRELLQAQNFECSSLGFRGLSGPSYRRPSAIVANIMEKLRERAVPQPHARARFSAVAKRVLNEKSVLNKLSSEFQSVLSPDNRKFLQNQGKKSPEVPRRRIIFGQKSFAFARDGEFVEIENPGGECYAVKENQEVSSDTEEPATPFSNPEVLLKLRRPSLQKQKKVEEDGDADEVFYEVFGNKGQPSDSEAPYNPGKCSQKAGKIPRRFLSSTNLKALEENVLQEAMRLEVEKEILSLSQKIKSISNQDLPSVLKQVKQLRSRLDNTTKEPSEVL